MSDDWRTANPDDLDRLADLMWTTDDGGAYGELTDLFRRARDLDATAEMAGLTSLQTWLRDAATQLRENAYILRNDIDGDGITDQPLYELGDRPSYLPEGSPLGEELRLADWQVEARTDAEEFTSVAGKDDLTEDDMALLEGYMDGNARDPAFAEAVIDEMGMEEYLRLAERVEAMDGSGPLLTSMGTALAAAMQAPAKPGTAAYEEWTENNPEGQRYLDRLNAFNEAGAQRLGSDDALGYEVAFDLLGQSRTPMDQEFFDQTLDHLNAPYRTGDGDAPWPEDLTDELLIAASLSSPLVVDHHLFSSYGGHGTTEVKIQWATDMLSRGEDLTDLERAQLSAVLAANQDDPRFAREVITGLGAEELLQTWADLMAPGTGTPTDEQLRIHTALDQNLGAVLGRATRTGSGDELEQWERDLIAAGDEIIEADGWYADGYQILSSLLESGTYQPQFLTKYGNELMAWEQRGEVPQWSRRPSQFSPLTEDFTWDPMTGYMETLSNHPNAATTFFSDPDAMEYALRERVTAEIPADRDSNGNDLALQATSAALLAAATGLTSDSTELASTATHSERQRNVFRKAMNLGAEFNNNFPEEFRESYARMLGSYSEMVYNTARVADGSGLPLNSQNLAVVVAQVSRSPETYDILHTSMIPEYAERIAADASSDLRQGPDEIGTVIGFLEEGRFAALEIDQENSEWRGRQYYQTALDITADYIPTGDTVVNWVARLEQVWVDFKAGDISEEMSQSREEYFNERNHFVNEMAGQWIENNPNPYPGQDADDWRADVERSFHNAAQNSGGPAARNLMEHAGIVSSSGSGDSE